MKWPKKIVSPSHALKLDTMVENNSTDIINTHTGQQLDRIVKNNSINMANATPSKILRSETQGRNNGEDTTTTGTLLTTSAPPLTVYKRRSRQGKSREDQSSLVQKTKSVWTAFSTVAITLERPGR